jgi:Cu(I)/Ag(I) efflux system membrane fusion protein
LIAVGVVAGLATWRSTRGPEVKPTSILANAPDKAKPTVAHEQLNLTEAQVKNAKAFVTAAAAVSESLAADKLADFNRNAPQVAPASEALLRSLPAGHPWRPLLERISGSGKLVSAGDLTEARKEFLPFSTAVSEFVRTARHQADALKALKLYRCPMAPQPGFWLQLKGPLRNPYFGSEMLTCGSELNE